MHPDEERSRSTAQLRIPSRGTLHESAFVMDFETFALASGAPKEIYGTVVFDKKRIFSKLEHYYLDDCASRINVIFWGI